MIIAHQHQDSYVLNLAPGEEVLSCIRQFCVDKGVAAATLTGLGAASEIELAYYHLPTKTYERKTMTEDLEIISLVGNIGLKHDTSELIIHIHGSFGRRDLSVIGGHLFSSTISGAGEIHLRILPGKITRQYDNDTGLNLMCRVKGDDLNKLERPS